MSGDMKIVCPNCNGVMNECPPPPGESGTWFHCPACGHVCKLAPPEGQKP